MKTFLVLLCGVLAACGSDKESPVAVTGEGKVVVTANWLDGTLSILDADALVDGVADRAAVETASIDLSAHSPGPFEVEITPNGKLALVAVSSGFFTIPFANVIVDETTIPTDAGGLLFIDLETREVVGDLLVTGDSPMGIRITKDSKRAFVGHFGSGDIAIVDIETRSVIDTVDVGIYVEELAFDDTETVGVVAYSDSSTVRTFAVNDLAGTLSDPILASEGDAAGVAFFPGTKTALVFQTSNGITARKSGYTLIDVADPAAPEVLQDVRWDEAVMGYGIAAHTARDSVILPLTLANKLVLREYTLGDNDIVLGDTTEVTDATLMGARAVAIDGEGRVLCAVPRERVLTVTDLDSQVSFAVPWATRAGPADVAVW